MVQLSLCYEVKMLSLLSDGDRPVACYDHFVFKVMAQRESPFCISQNIYLFCTEVCLIQAAVDYRYARYWNSCFFRSTVKLIYDLYSIRAHNYLIFVSVLGQKRVPESHPNLFPVTHLSELSLQVQREHNSKVSLPQSTEINYALYCTVLLSLRHPMGQIYYVKKI